MLITLGNISRSNFGIKQVPYTENIFFFSFECIQLHVFFHSLLYICNYAFYLNLYQYSKITINKTYTFLRSLKTIFVQKDEIKMYFTKPHMYWCIESKRYLLYLNVLACESGFYGFGCNGTCGHCLDVNQCSNTNGTCLTGCDVGYKGELCKTRELISTKYILNLKM